MESYRKWFDPILDNFDKLGTSQEGLHKIEHLCVNFEYCFKKI